MKICGLCGLSKALCVHPDWGWFSSPLMGAALRFLLGWFLGELGHVFPGFNRASLTDFASQMGLTLMQLMHEVDWVAVGEVVILVVVTLIL